MRVKSDTRRQAIIDAATDLFREVGYERASMAQISARVGGSKATLYSYFTSKEELFATAMCDAMAEQADAMIALLDASEPNIATVLTRFAAAYLDLVSSGHCVNGIRTAIGQGANSELGPTLYRMGPRKGLQQIAAYIGQLIDQGRFRPGDPWHVSLHFKGLLDAGLYEPRLFGAPQEISHETAIHEAVAAFLRAYKV